MNVLFIQFSGLQESIGIASLAASLQNAGHKSDIILMSHCKDLKEEIERFRPGLIGFSALTGAHNEVLELSAFVRKETGIPTILGGPHATYYSEEIIKTDSVDYICRGEGEEALVELTNRLSRGLDTGGIPNIWSHKNGGWRKNDLGMLVEDLDTRPIPMREIYYKYGFLRDMPLKRFITGIGCPYPCTFCHSPLLKREYEGKGRFVRRKSVQRVIEEILAVKKVSAIRTIHFSDDTFTLDKGWLAEFSRRYPAEVKIPFTCNARLDSRMEDIDLLASAGCRGVQLGFESGSERVRKQYLRKFWSNDYAGKVVERFRSRGIRTLATNMIALPGETLHDSFLTVEWNSRLNFNFARCNVYMPFPRLDLTLIAKAEGLLDRDYSLSDYKPDALNPVFNKQHSRELINLANIFYLAVKLPFLRKFMLSKAIKIRPNAFFDFIGSLNLLQEYFFFGLRPFSSWRYFKNTLGSFRGFKYGSWPATRILDSRQKKGQKEAEVGQG